MNAFPIGLSALTAGRRGLDLVGQNVANAATPGYHRQAVNLVSRTTDGANGSGVDVATITRYEANPVRTAVLRATSEEAAASARLSAQQQLETAIGTEPATVGAKLEEFFNQVEQLTAAPAETAARRPLVAAATDLAARFNAAAQDIDQLRSDTRAEVGQTVTDVNSLAGQVAAFNKRIAGVIAQGGEANDLRDQRDQAISQLASKLDIRTFAQDDGTVNVISTGAALVVGVTANTLQSNVDATGRLNVTQAGITTPLTFSSGSLAGQLAAYNDDLPAARGRLDTMAGELVRRTNAVQATGLGTGGPVASAAGSVAVPDATAPLAGQVLPFPIQAGNLVVSVTDSAGVRTNHTVAIDPAAQSLQDVAAAVTAGTGGAVSGSIDPETKSLRFDAAAGYKFDFAGRPPSPPGVSSAVADPDAAGLLSGLGVNGLFSGTDARNIAVRPELTADPGRLAASRSGQPGDGSNLERLAAVRDQAAIGNRTLAQGFTDLSAEVGTRVQQLTDAKAAHTGLVQSFSAQEQAVSGVDVNEELVRLLDYQRMIEGASRYMSVVNSTLDTIMQLVR